MVKIKKLLFGCFAVTLLSLSFANVSSAASMVIDMPGHYNFLNSTASGGTETITTGAGDPGLGTATLNAGSVYVDTNNTGTLPDKFTIPAGLFIGQRILVVLRTDTEVSGLNVVPSSQMVGTSTVFSDAGDNGLYEWGGASWHIILNKGGTAR